MSTYPPESLPWTVYVDDNFHHMDEDERIVDGHFATLEEAILRCMAITRDSVDEHGSAYTQFGEDPWVAPKPTPDELEAILARHPEWHRHAFANGFFSAWSYAETLHDS